MRTVKISDVFLARIISPLTVIFGAIGFAVGLLIKNRFVDFFAGIDDSFFMVGPPIFAIMGIHYLIAYTTVARQNSIIETSYESLTSTLDHVDYWYYFVENTIGVDAKNSTVFLKSIDGESISLPVDKVRSVKRVPNSANTIIYNNNYTDSDGSVGRHKEGKEKTDGGEDNRRWLDQSKGMSGLVFNIDHADASELFIVVHQDDIPEWESLLAKLFKGKLKSVGEPVHYPS